MTDDSVDPYLLPESEGSEDEDSLSDAPTVPPPGTPAVDPARLDSDEEDVLEPGSTEVEADPMGETLTESQISLEEITDDDPALQSAADHLKPAGSSEVGPPSSSDMPALGDGESDEVLLVETASTRLPPALLQPVPGGKEIVDPSPDL